MREAGLVKVLIVYASTEGQTSKIARFALDRLAGVGHSVALLPAGDSGDVEPSAYDAAILAASVHAGRYQDEMVAFASDHAAALAGMKTLFLSVSLAAAGQDADDMKELTAIVGRFAGKTGWTPGEVEHVAGAFRFGEYDFFKYWAMRWIESKKAPSETPGTDREYTDWDALGRRLDDWIDS